MDTEKSESKLMQVLKQFGLLAAMGSVGAGLLIYGVWMAIVPEPPKVEISAEVKGETETKGPTIFVDVGGAVAKSGVYILPEKSRIGDAIVAAGGVTEEADGEWVAKNLNMAQEVKDGGKIYIPEEVENTESQIAGNYDKSESSISSESRAARTLVNINEAGQKDLESLWGIGESRAQAIIAARPYGDAQELVSKAKIPQSVYDKIKDLISVY